ncbi:MAG: branched-chain amino acid ABC transporter permease [Sulfitobacter sp.]
MAGLGLILLVGQSGQTSLGHAAFMAIGAYANVLLQTRAGLPFIAAFPLAGLISGLAGLALAIPTARLHGIYLAIATLAVSIMFEDVILLAAPLTGGANGVFAPSIEVFGLGIDRYINPDRFYWLVLIVLVLATFAYRNILRSPTGRAFAAVRDSRISAQAMGINVAHTKAIAFAASTMLRTRSGRTHWPGGRSSQ